MASLGTLGVATPWDADDTTYHTFTDDTDLDPANYALDNVPANFGVMNSDLAWTVVSRLRDAPPADLDTYTLSIAIVNGTTVLAGASATYDGTGYTHCQAIGTVTTNSDQTDGSTTFTYVNTTADKATWDAAQVYLIQGYSKNKGGDGNAVQADYVAFTGTYIADYPITIESGTFDQVPTDVGTEYGRVLTVESTTFDQVPTDVNIIRFNDYPITFDPATFDQANTDVTFLRGYTLIAESTTADQANTDVTFDRTYQLVVGSTTADQANTDVSTLHNKQITLESTTADQANTDVSFARTYVLAVDPGTFDQANTDVTLNKGFKITAEPKSAPYNQVENDVNFPAGRYINLNQTIFDQAPTDVNFNYWHLNAEPSGAITFSGSDVGITYSHVLTADPGTFTFSGSTVLLEQKPITLGIWFRVPNDYQTIWINL